MPITTYICQKPELSDSIKSLLISEFHISTDDSKSLAVHWFKRYFDVVQDDVWFLIEAPYVDKVYRDSYYHYFSSKTKSYAKDCIKISLFNQEVAEEQFRSVDGLSSLQDNYLGFVIIRPTEPNIIGRSTISPKAMKVQNFNICTTSMPITVNSIKLNATGFPHSSQDGETITCAETSLWAIMEYFSSKYPDYKPILPFKITETLINVSAERLIPSKGLNIPQIAYALKQFGFGPRIYARQMFGEPDFHRLLSCYVESGIPLIIAMENRKAGGAIGHALLCIGHEKITDEKIDNLGVAILTNSDLQKAINTKGITLYDNDEISKEFVFIDDNHHPYNLAPLTNPSKCYLPDNPEWDKCIITFFIVPLYPKIHLEAYEAKNLILSLLTLGPYSLSNGREVFLRTFLTSTRSFKHSIATNADLSDDVKALILETPMPKFLWIGELSNKGLIKNGKANGMIILDATESNNFSLKPLIMAFYENNMINFSTSTGKLDKTAVPLPDFSIYINNLNGF